MLDEAIRYGHLAFATRFITTTHVLPRNDWKWANILAEAAGGGHLAFAQWLVSLGCVPQDKKYVSLSFALRKAAEGGHLHFAQWLLSWACRLPQDYDWEWNDALEGSVGHVHFSKWLLSLQQVPKDNVWEWNSVLYYTACNGDITYGKWFMSLEQIPKEYNWDWNHALAAAARNGQLSFAQWLTSLSNIPEMYKWNWERGFEEAVNRERTFGENKFPSPHFEFVKWILLKCPCIHYVSYHDRAFIDIQKNEYEFFYAYLSRVRFWHRDLATIICEYLCGLQVIHLEKCLKSPRGVNHMAKPLA